MGSRKGLTLVLCGGQPPAGTQLAGDGRKEPGLLGEVFRVFQNHPDGSMAQIRDQNQENLIEEPKIKTKSGGD